jgi:hypothetical protein
MIGFQLGIGIDFAGAVKEKQRRADSQHFKAWSNFIARTGSAHFFIGYSE